MVWQHFLRWPLMWNLKVHRRTIFSSAFQSCQAVTYFSHTPFWNDFFDIDLYLYLFNNIWRYTMNRVWEQPWTELCCRHLCQDPAVPAVHSWTASPGPPLSLPAAYGAPAWWLFPSAASSPVPERERDDINFTEHTQASPLHLCTASSHWLLAVFMRHSALTSYVTIHVNMQQRKLQAYFYQLLLFWITEINSGFLYRRHLWMWGLLGSKIHVK